MKRRGHPVRGAIAGFLFGVFAALTALVFGVVALDSPVLLVLPVLFLVVGIAWGKAAPMGRDAPAPAEGPTAF